MTLSEGVYPKLRKSGLGNALGDIAKYGASKLFAEVTLEIALENNLRAVRVLTAIAYVLEFRKRAI